MFPFPRPIPGPPILSASVTMTCLYATGGRVNVPVLLVYQENDPYAVRMIFHPDDSTADALRVGPKPEGAIWEICRATLFAGLRAPAGVGDLRVHPAFDERGDTKLILDFASPGGTMSVETSAEPLRAFLAHTLEQVAFGKESEHLPLDATIEMLLNQG